jgi:hypothetical protein
MLPVYVYTVCCYALQEFRDAAREHSLGQGDKDLVADDRILQCAMHVQQRQRQQQAAAGVAAGLVLLTSDMVLQIKVSGTALLTLRLIC